MIKKFPIGYLCKAFLLTLVYSGSFAQAPQSKQKKQSAAPKTAKTASTKLKTGPVRIKISTDSGTIIVALSDSTPLHRDNFVKLVNEGFYDSLLFHRVIPAFMIQGGDPTSKNAEPGMALGNGGSEMTRIPAEFNPVLYHKKGALAAARDDNPQKSSSACQFYIVEGKIYTDEQLNIYDQQRTIKYSPAQREMYKTIGGTPQLDMKYTVFGEVETGLDVIGKISHVTKDNMNRPLGNVRIKMEIIY